MDPFDEAVSAALNPSPRPKTMGGGGPTFQPGFPMGSKKDVDSLRNETDIANALEQRDALRYPDVNGGSYSNSTSAPSSNAGKWSVPGSLGENPNIDNYEEEAQYQAYGDNPQFNPDWTHAQNTAAMAFRKDKYDRLMLRDQTIRDRENQVRQDAIEAITAPIDALEGYVAKYPEEVTLQLMQLQFPDVTPEQISAAYAQKESDALTEGLDADVQTIGAETDYRTLEEGLAADFSFAPDIDYSDSSQMSQEQYDALKSAINLSDEEMNERGMFVRTTDPDSTLSGRFGYDNLNEEDVREDLRVNAEPVQAILDMAEGLIDTDVSSAEIIAEVQVMIAQYNDNGVTLSDSTQRFVLKQIADYQDRWNTDVLARQADGTMPAARPYGTPDSSVNTNETYWQNR